MNQKKKFLQKNSVYLYNSQTLSRQNYEEIMQILNNLPPIKKNHYIYLLYKQKNKKYELIIIKKEFFKKIEKNEKKTIIKNIKKYLKTKTINNILNSLYKKSKIILNFNQTK
ncbi:hypothetical protein [Buchnera aphidicola]|uniref:hypothetical protein n=1 Tax=Buchnera aphidicola TaxID=9 RepID=UPI0002E25728|nr:hypothetical protein [Buchnera aphidicola]